MSKSKMLGQAVKALGKDIKVNVSNSFPTYFGMEPLDMNAISLHEYVAERKKLFEDCTVHYVHPKDFKFALPPAGLPEVAFIGRSNVGKSSLIEGLTGKRGIAKVSKSPGCTKTLNFFAFVPDKFKGLPEFTVDHHNCYLVDMPGYGYAKASREEQERWLKVMSDYLTTRDQLVLRRIFLLIDGRHGVKPADIEMMSILNNKQTPYQMIFTKCDLVQPTELLDNVKSTLGVLRRMRNSTGLPFIHTVSSTTGLGMHTLELALAEIYLDSKYSGVRDEEEDEDEDEDEDEE